MAKVILDEIETYIELADDAEWAEWWAANKEAMDGENMPEEIAYNLACNCSLLIGGGAAPMFRVGFQM
jgi:hypothetical protein